MPTQVEEEQAKEFLKRAEIRTMRKDLLSLREVDSLKERDKIAKIKTLEEQLQEQEKKMQQQEQLQKYQLEEVLQKNEGQQKLAEKDLKNYATEQERQQIFLLESQRLGFEKEIDLIDKEKEPALKLEKNKTLLQKRDAEQKLNQIIAQEKSLEEEQKFISEKEKTTAITEEKKSLESGRWDLDKKIQEIEKERWKAEKQVQDFDTKLKQIDKSSELNTTEKNNLRQKILGIDKSLREIYSVIMEREEEKISGRAKEQVARREALSQAKMEKNEQVQRRQWTRAPVNSIPVPEKNNRNNGLEIPQKKIHQDKMQKIKGSFKAEEEQRQKFLKNVEQGSQFSQQQKSNISLR